MNKETIPHAKEFLGDSSTQLLINQLLLTMVRREGGRVVLPAHLVDETGGYMLNLAIDPISKAIILNTEKKQ